MKISGEKIKNIRISKNMSRAELSRQSGVPIRTLEDWEAGRRNPTNIDVVIQIAQSLQVDLNELYSERYLSELNAQALSNMEQFFDSEEDEKVLISKIEDIYASQGHIGLARLIDRFISHIGIDEALNIVEDYINEDSAN